MQVDHARPKVTINWNNQARKFKMKFDKLTDQDLYFEEGQMEEMLTRLQTKTGKTRHELYQMIIHL